MASGTIHQTLSDIKIGEIRATIPAGATVVRSITAPTYSGYEFVSWLGANTSGWVGYAYPSNWTVSTCDFWATSGTSTNDRSINCYALYKKR